MLLDLPVVLPHRKVLLGQPLPSVLPKSLGVTANCLETIEVFARHVLASKEVAKQLVLCQRKASGTVCWYRWSVLRVWCTSKGCTFHPYVSKAVDFLLFFISL